MTAHPTFGNGKICYIEIPAIDIEQAVRFYHTVFGWNIRRDNDGNASFDDGVGEVSGMWVAGRKPSTESGMLVSIMVENLEHTLQAVLDNGGAITQPPEKFGNSEKTALISDPSGNVWCLYHHGG